MAPPVDAAGADSRTGQAVPEPVQPSYRIGGCIGGGRSTKKVEQVIRTPAVRWRGGLRNQMTDQPRKATEDDVTKIAPMTDPEQVALSPRGTEGRPAWTGGSFSTFRGQNPVASAMVGLGWTTRRSFALVPAEGDPVALIHAIEHSSWRHWPWAKKDYASWRDMESEVGGTGGGADAPGHGGILSFERSDPRQDSGGDAGAVPKEVGVEPVSSGDLVSTFYSVWSEEQLQEHRASAETVRAGRARRIRQSRGPRSPGLSSSRGTTRRLDSIGAHGVGASGSVRGHPCGHRSQCRRSALRSLVMPERIIVEGEVLLIDLWGKHDGRRSAGRPDLDGYPGGLGARAGADDLGGGPWLSRGWDRVSS